jgi:hypothetical protein
MTSEEDFKFQIIVIFISIKIVLKTFKTVFKKGLNSKIKQILSYNELMTHKS